MGRRLSVYEVRRANLFRLVSSRPLTFGIVKCCMRVYFKLRGFCCHIFLFQNRFGEHELDHGVVFIHGPGGKRESQRSAVLNEVGLFAVGQIDG